MCSQHPNAPAYVSKSGKHRKLCLECHRKRSRDWNAKHRLVCREKNAQWYIANAAAVRKKRSSPVVRVRLNEAARLAGRRKLRESSDVTPPHVGRCLICERQKLLVYDHDHVTKSFRGWICGRCNRGLGYFGDAYAGVARAAAYLEGHERTGGG